MKLDINMLVRQMAAERDIEAETLVDAVAEAISSAARKHYKERNVHTDIDVEPVWKRPLFWVFPLLLLVLLAIAVMLLSGGDDSAVQDSTSPVSTSMSVWTLRSL